MELITKAISKILGYHFNIPNFQRGYRWEKQQICDLLDDLLEYYESTQEDSNKNFGDYYCLQPIVIKKNSVLSQDKGYDFYDVIDGQQRLTTIYLILSLIEDVRKILHPKTYNDLFSIGFEERDDEMYLDNKDFNKDETKYKEYINYFFIKQAYLTIQEWFKQKTNVESDILRVLLGDKGIEEKKVVKVIWYDLSDTKESSIDVFTRLNYGKIPLTDAELIKALLFECDRYTIAEQPQMRERVFRMSCEWDDMEKKLHNPYFWSFIVPSTYQPSSRISFILHNVARRLNEWNFAEEKDYFDYHVLNAYLLIDGNTVENLWNLIQDTFTVFNNWYQNREIYHLIGYLEAVIEYNKRSRKNEIKTEVNNLIGNLFNLYLSSSKTNFIIELRCKVATESKIKEQINNTDGSNEQRCCRLDEIQYPSADLVRILLLFNADAMISNSMERAYYPFDKQKKQNITSLEHIHPQNLDTNFDGNNNDYSIKVQPWLSSKRTSLRELEDHGDLIDKISLFEDFNYFQSNIDACRNLIAEIDSLFNDYIKLGDEEMHSVKNMALLSKEVNSAIGNGFMDEKRKKLKEKEKEEWYIPLCTRKVFNKSFTQHPSNLKFWERDDREAYFEAIKKVYNKYQEYIK